MVVLWYNFMQIHTLLPFTEGYVDKFVCNLSYPCNNCQSSISLEHLKMFVPQSNIVARVESKVYFYNVTGPGLNRENWCICEIAVICSCFIRA